MPIQPISFPMLSFEQANPSLVGAKYGQEMAQSGLKFPLEQEARRLANAIAAVNAQYAEPLKMEELEKAQLYNQYYGPDIESQMGLRSAQAGLAGAQAGLAGTEAEKIRFLLKNPAYMNPEAAMISYALQQQAPSGNAPQANASQTSAMPAIGTGIGMPAIPPAGQQMPAQQAAGQPAITNTNTQAGAGPAWAPFNTPNPMANAILNKQFAGPAYQARMTQGWDWVHTPVDAQNYQIAQLAGAGIDPSSAVAQLSSGKKVGEILKENGFDPNNPPEPDFLPTRGNIEKLKQRQAALKELNIINDFVQKGYGPYAQTVAGMSPLQIKDALLGLNKEQQEDFLAARILSSESSFLRLTVAQSPAGSNAVDEIMKRSMLDVEPLRPSVTSDVWMGAQKKADKKLTEAFERASEAYSRVGDRGRKEKTGKQGAENSGTGDPLGLR